MTTLFLDVTSSARRFVEATRALSNAEGSRWYEASIERDTAWHELICSVGECFLCEPGTCPYDATEDARAAKIEVAKSEPGDASTSPALAATSVKDAT